MHRSIALIRAALASVINQAKIERTSAQFQYLCAEKKAFEHAAIELPDISPTISTLEAEFARIFEPLDETVSVISDVAMAMAIPMPMPMPMDKAKAKAEAKAKVKAKANAKAKTIGVEEQCSTIDMASFISPACSEALERLEKTLESGLGSQEVLKSLTTITSHLNSLERTIDNAKFKRRRNEAENGIIELKQYLMVTKPRGLDSSRIKDLLLEAEKAFGLNDYETVMKLTTQGKELAVQLEMRYNEVSAHERINAVRSRTTVLEDAGVDISEAHEWLYSAEISVKAHDFDAVNEYTDRAAGIVKHAEDVFYSAKAEEIITDVVKELQALESDDHFLDVDLSMELAELRTTLKEAKQLLTDSPIRSYELANKCAKAIDEKDRHLFFPLAKSALEKTEAKISSFTPSPDIDHTQALLTQARAVLRDHPKKAMALVALADENLDALGRSQQKATAQEAIDALTAIIQDFKRYHSDSAQIEREQSKAGSLLASGEYAAAEKLAREAWFKATLALKNIRTAYEAEQAEIDEHLKIIAGIFEENKTLIDELQVARLQTLLVSVSRWVVTDTGFVEGARETILTTTTPVEPLQIQTPVEARGMIDELEKQLKATICGYIESFNFPKEKQQAVWNMDLRELNSYRRLVEIYYPKKANSE